MKHILITSLVLALSGLGAGCLTNAPMDITAAGGQSILPVDLTLSNVRPGIRLATLEDSLKQLGSTFNVHSGKVFRRVFTGGDDAPASIELVNSSIQQSIADNFIVWQTQQVVYTATVELRYNGQVRTLHSTGMGTTGINTDRAAREAIERAVIDIAKQAQVYLRNPPPIPQ